MDAKDSAAAGVCQKLVEARELQPWRWQFRASGLPACPLQHVWSVLDQEIGRLPRRPWGFLADFYTEVGTAVHTVTQRWLGRLGLLYGPWVCTRCGARFDPALGPVRCFDCDVEAEYEEFSFDGEPSGHCDGLLRVPGVTTEPNQFVLLEIKTTSATRLDSVILPNGPPYPYQLQTTNYAYRLGKMGYTITDVLFLFIPRDSPNRMTPIWYKPVAIERVNRAILNEYRQTVDALEQNDYQNVTGTCRDPADAGNCCYRVDCFGPAAAQLFCDKHTKARSTEPVSYPAFPNRIDNQSGA